MSEPLPFRIGDAERDDAAALLRDHMTMGRLDHDEFDERLGKALTAHTQAELDALFTDLPGRRPGQAVATPTPSLDAARYGDVRRPPARPVKPYVAPWWTHWMLFVAAIALAGITRGELGPLVGIAAVWVWWLGPSIARSRYQQEIAEQERRELER